MQPAVKLRDLTNSLDLPQEWTAWLDLETGRVIELDPDTRNAAEEPDEDAAFRSDLAPNEELWTAARAIGAGDPRYLALPDAFDFHEYRHMERFVTGVTDPLLADQLWRAIKGKGAFRHFKDAAHRLDLIEDWYRFRDEAARRHMLRWAEAHGIPVDESSV
jgi:hypothetical protein